MQVNAIKVLGANPGGAELHAQNLNAARLAGSGEANAAAIEGISRRSEELNRDAAAQALKELNQAAEALDSGLRFQIDDKSNQVVIQIVNRTTGEVLQEIPSELSRRLAQALGKAAGLLVDKRA